MTLLSARPNFRVLLIAALVMVLAIALGIARMSGWSAVAAGNVPGVVSPKGAPIPKPSAAYARRMCAACGVVTSMREIAITKEDALRQKMTIADAGSTGGATGSSGMKYEIIVSMADGSSRVFEEANPSTWRVGGRLIFIDAGHLSD